MGNKETEALSGRVAIGAQRHNAEEKGKVVNFINFLALRSTP